MNDNFLKFNTGGSISHFCNFIEYYDVNSNRFTMDTLTFVPYTKSFQQYSVAGKLKKIIDASEMFDYYGQKLLALSSNGLQYVLSHEDTCNLKKLSVI